ncbi:MAG TPA: helix-turn-helix domain-containing protein [Candidatus Copromorpha excrementigallinarum]|uniref:Helix-turn-helix domain-containing protein n=1 Tax=Candidatus Allocopromorpha excrementigallinarum TaxID=2840742 RepID=A0A9D1L6H7_9FIRM|nr:helix-turn-helix domain-containing protein [Candidatus Copromorpha excrementigallinarum]
MLKEKIIYKDELPINVITACIEEYPIHFHDDMEVIYVLDGSVILRNGYYTYTLKQGDIFIINDREMHSFENTGEDNMVMMLQLDLSYFSRYYDSLKNNFFVTDMEDDSDESLEVLKNIMARIMMEVLQKGYGYEQKVIESTHNLIACLLSDFQYFVMEDGKFKNEAKNKGNKILAGRLNRITDYMYDNYSRKLTLNEIAEREHLSIYYLSHIIKEATGLSFQDLLSYIRVEESERLLLGTNKKIGAIAEETGFSAVRYYIKHFENWFGMHPLEYRRKYIGKIISREIRARYVRCSPEQIEEAIRKQVKGVYADYAGNQKMKPVIIDIDIYDDYAAVEKKTPAIAEIMEREVNSIIAEPYMRLKKMKENVVASGENYLITTRCKYPGPLDSLSILVYNFDENIGRSLRKIVGEEDLLRIVRNYDEEIEFLVRCTGLSGTFKILRYRIEKDTFTSKIENSINPLKNTDYRANFINRLASQASVSVGSYTSSDALSIRSTFKGAGAELVLLDKKKDRL